MYLPGNGAAWVSCGSASATAGGGAGLSRGQKMARRMPINRSSATGRERFTTRNDARLVRVVRPDVGGERQVVVAAVRRVTDRVDPAGVSVRHAHGADRGAAGAAVR